MEQMKKNIDKMGGCTLPDQYPTIGFKSIRRVRMLLKIDDPNIGKFRKRFEAILRIIIKMKIKIKRVNSRAITIKSFSVD
jgi:hypothetical protein